MWPAKNFLAFCDSFMLLIIIFFSADLRWGPFFFFFKCDIEPNGLLSYAHDQLII